MDIITVILNLVTAIIELTTAIILYRMTRKR